MQLRVKELREEKGWNQTVLGYHAGLSPSQISQIENGRRNPTVETLEGIATALGVGVGDLFPKAEAPPEQESPERRNPEDVWRAEYLARADEMLDKWEGEFEEKAALAESDTVRFLEWVQEIRKFGNPHMMGIVAGYTTTTDFEFEAVIGAAEFLGPYGDLWRRIEDLVEKTTKFSEEDERLLRKWINEGRAFKNLGGKS